MSWNCRALWGSFTVSQLKESLRLFMPELIFVCETKKRKGFVSTVCKKLGGRREGVDRWHVVNLVERSRGLLLEWEKEVTIY